MTLRDWSNNGWLVEHPQSSEEIQNLLAVIDRDIRDATTQGLSADWRFAIAYNAILQCAVTALAASGFRPARQSHHYYAIQSLALTIQETQEDLITLDAFRKKRNVLDYERAGAVSEADTSEILDSARDLHARLLEWLKKNHAELLESSE